MLLTFTKPEFEGLIKKSIKLHTIREDKNNRWKVGNSIQFWMGNPRNVKNHPYQFGVGVCSRVEKIAMNFQQHREDNPDTVEIGATTLRSMEELNAFAVKDGFTNWYDMSLFFGKHGERFEGKIIFWEDFVWL